MYYHKLTGRLVLDALDYFLISAFLMSSLASYLKDYFSEKASIDRLKNDIIAQSRLIEPSKSANKLSSKERKIQKIYKVAFDNHGGAAYESKRADKIKDFVIQLAFLLKKKELQSKIFKFIFTQGRIILQLLLAKCNIDLQYILLDHPVSPQIVVMASCIGGTTGFVCSWFSVGAILFAPPAIFSILVFRSVVQQTRANMESKNLNKDLTKALKNKNLTEEVKKWVKNSKAIKLESLNWNQNPAIQQAAEQLGILNNPASLDEPINFDTLDPDLKKIMEEIGVMKKNMKPLTPKKVAKTVHFRDFIDEIRESENDLGFDVIDVTPVQEPLGIRIKD